MAAQESRTDTAMRPAIVSAVPPELAPSAVVKEIDDPGSGVRWLLVADPAHPGGPGRMVAAGSGVHGVPWSLRAASRARPVVCSGDAVQVEEHSTVMDMSLQAVALNSARAGERLQARLRIGGRVVTAIVLGPGRAVLAPTGGVQ